MAALNNTRTLNRLAHTVSVFCRPGLGKTSYSSNRKLPLTEIGYIMDPYVPPPRVPFSWAGCASLFNACRKFVFAAIHKSKLKKDIAKFVPKYFPAEAEQLYIQMNKTFASGRVKDLQPLVTTSMLATLKNQQAQIKETSGKLNWEYLGAVVPPRTAHTCYVRHPDESMGGFAQITVKIHSRQRLSVIGHNNKTVSQTESNPVEYVVFERLVRPGGTWRIAGKINMDA